MEDVSDARRKWLRSNYLKCQGSIFWGNYHQSLPHLLLKIRKPALLLGFFHLSYVGFELPHNQIIFLPFLAGFLSFPRVSQTMIFILLGIHLHLFPHFPTRPFHLMNISQASRDSPLLSSYSQTLSELSVPITFRYDNITAMCWARCTSWVGRERGAYMKKSWNVCFHLIHLPTLVVI